MIRERFRPERAGGTMLWAAVAVLTAVAANLRAGLSGLPEQVSVPAAPKDSRVRAKILADVRAVQPGKSFRVGVLLEMRPGWHVYWKNPGDGGLATSVEFAVPKGFSAGPLRWPIPVRFEQAGNITGFGYEKSVLLWAKITAPKRLNPGSRVRIGASVSWLACKAQCVPGEAELEVKLPVKEKAEADNAKLFAQWQSRLPRKPGLPEAGVTARVRGSVPGGSAWGTIRIELAWKDKAPAKVEWFPGPSEALEIGKLSIRSAGRKTEISIPARVMPGQKLSVKTLESLVVYSDKGGPRRAIEVPVPLRPTRKGRRGGAKSETDN